MRIAGLTARDSAPRLLPVLAPLVTVLVVGRSWHAVAAVALAALALLAVCGPFAALSLIPLSVAGGVTATLPAVAVVTLVVAVRAVAGFRRPRPPHLVIAALALLVLAAYFFPSAGLTPQPDRAADLIALLAGLGMAAATAASPPSPDAIARVTALTGGIAAGVALALGEQAGGRLQAFGLNPNYLGTYLALPLVASAGLARRHRQPLWLVPAAACLAGMVATQSRGAFVAGVAGVAIVFVHGRRPGRQALIVAVAAASGVLFPGVIRAAERIAAGGRKAAELSYDTAVRENVAWFAARVAIDHPLRGIGYGMFPRYAENSTSLGIYLATHNDYLRLAAESGIPSLIAFLALVQIGMRRRGDLGVLRAMTAAYAAGLFFANELANLAVSTPFWLSLGCLLAASRLPEGAEHT